jgi:hypothetical protein
MTTKTYNKIDLAANQLETAIGLLISGGDRFSVITLAGAADVILCQLVSNKSKENFTEYSLKLSRKRGINNDSRESHGRMINDILHINDLKHMDKGDDGLVEMDVDSCAITAIAKGIANYVMLRGTIIPFVQAYLKWCRLNLDPQLYNVYCNPNWESHQD